MRTLYDQDIDTVARCLGILERGLRRFGIDPRAPVMSALAARTIVAGDLSIHERQKAVALKRRGAYELSEHQIERIATLSDQGWTQKEIAREIGCNQSTVAKKLLRLGRRKLRTCRMAAA